jgi:hypothetical protein
MSRRSIIALLVAAVISFVAYRLFLPNIPSGIEPKGGDGSATIAYISLATSIVSFLTALVGFFKLVIEKKATK